MASITMSASFLTVSVRPLVTRRRHPVVMAKAASAEGQEIDSNKANNARRNMMVAALAAAISTVGSVRGIAIAAEDPKSGTPEARKLYAPVCVTMPTAKICHK